ncbi:MAG TPA: dihydropteroate synthase [Paracoccaceae bacterium]|nr:dihydropteroate synthase [Paracoccaceae bacterium]
MTGSERWFRPLPCALALPGARPLAGGFFGFREVEVLARGRAPEVLPAEAVPAIWPGAGAALERASATPAPLLGLTLDRPRIMGIVNVTPDSFSDGGRFSGTRQAVAHALALAQAGADVLDVGGESTRPGSDPVPEAEELDRVLPVIEGLVAECPVPVSVDTRNAGVMRAALGLGARMVNDISGLMHDAQAATAAAGAEAVCLMHAQGDPKTMQRNPAYDDVLLDVFDWLEARVAAAEAAGIPRARIMIDPGIGFGKTLEHNLALIRRLSLFQTLGCAVLLGVSRKGFVGRLSGEAEPGRRAAGSISAGLAGLGQGAQILRVHDVAETAQAMRVWQAIEEGR